MAHEFWIAPENFVYAPDERVQVNLKVGEKYDGSSYSYNPNNFERFEVISGGVTSTVKGRLGDVPAMSLDSAPEGLMTIVHETDDSLLTYSNWEKFKRFVDHKAFPTTLEDHVTRGIPKDEKFTESYRRFAKSLVAVGSGAGEDVETGMQTEIIALANPYTDDIDVMPVKVMLDGAPRSGTQVELFEKSPSGEVEVTLYQTDAEGMAEVPVKAGYSYLIDAVAMIPLDNDDASAGPVWKSLWASLTFQVPDAN